MEENRLNVLLTLIEDGITTDEVIDLIDTYILLNQQKGLTLHQSTHQFKRFIMSLCDKSLGVCLQFNTGKIKATELEVPKRILDELLSPDQVGEILQISSQYVRRLIKEGKIKGVKYSERITRVSRKDLDDYINSMNNSRKKK